MRASATFRILESIVTGNESEIGRGGGVMVHSLNGGYSEVVDNVLIDNDGIRGGGLFAEASYGGSVDVLRNSVEGNSAFAGGGGAYGLAGDGGRITISELAAIANETAEELGGGLAIRTFGTGQVSASKVIAQGNSALAGGGVAMFLNGGTASLDSATLEGNSIRGAGGGLFVQSFSNAAALVTSVTAADNTAQSNGGGMWLVAS